MSAILIKIFATALAFSQVVTRPDAVKTQFDPVRDQAEVVQLLRDGCTQMRKAFDVEEVNFDELIATSVARRAQELEASLARVRSAWMAGRSALEHCPAEWRGAVEGQQNHGLVVLKTL